MSMHNSPMSKRARRKPLLIAYLRVSSDRQADEGQSLETQLARIREFVAGRGFGLHPVFHQDFQSAWDHRSVMRPGYLKAIKNAERLGAGIVVTSVDRLSRSPAALKPVLQKRIKIFSVDDGGRVSIRTLRSKVYEAAQFSHRISEKQRDVYLKSGRGRRRGPPLQARKKGCEANMKRRDGNVGAVADYIRSHPSLVQRTWRERADQLNEAGVRKVRCARHSELDQWTTGALRALWPRIEAELAKNTGNDTGDQINPRKP